MANQRLLKMAGFTRPLTGMRLLEDGQQRSLYLHRLVMGATPGQSVWHADKDGLNNRTMPGYGSGRP